MQNGDPGPSTLSEGISCARTRDAGTSEMFGLRPRRPGPTSGPRGHAGRGSHPGILEPTVRSTERPEKATRGPNVGASLCPANVRQPLLRGREVARARPNAAGSVSERADRAAGARKPAPGPGRRGVSPSVGCRGARAVGSAGGTPRPPAGATGGSGRGRDSPSVSLGVFTCSFNRKKKSLQNGVPGTLCESSSGRL